MKQTWTEKYRPKKFEDIKGQELAIEKINNFGTGKTTLAHVTANETNSEIFELNASDLRNKAKLQEILKPAIEQKSLVKKNKIILVDEVDGISAVDRGGLIELLTLIELTSFPIIITANDVWNRKLSPLRKKSELVQIKEIPYGKIKNVMIDILRKENKFIDNNILTKIAVNSKGDLRTRETKKQIFLVY